ncbi:MAG: hypothetical protein D6766_12495, partial [Verrucomicrobia bacterium]
CRNLRQQAGPAEFAGEYRLVSVNGQELPATIAHQDARLEVRSGTLNLQPDGTCRVTTVFVPPNGAEIVREVQGEYTLQGHTFTIRWQNAGTTSATIKGRTFTLDNEGLLFTYRK